MKNKILLVEDELDMSLIVADTLCAEGYDVATAADGASGLNKFITEGADLVIADVMMPKMDGVQATMKLREEKNIPIIMLSAKSEDYDKITGLNVGADDYVTKPFNTKELLARIAVQLRNATAYEKASVLTFEDIAMCTDTHSVTVLEDEVKLTRTEFAILKLFLQNPSQVLPKSLLLERISEDTPDCTESSLKMHVSNLRKKLRDAGGRDYIEAVWGIGFKLRST